MAKICEVECLIPIFLLPPSQIYVVGRFCVKLGFLGGFSMLYREKNYRRINFTICTSIEKVFYMENYKFYLMDGVFSFTASLRFSEKQCNIQ